MENAKRWIAACLVVAVCLAGLSAYYLFKIHSLWEAVEWLECQNDELERDVSNLSSHLSALRSQMEEKIRDAASLFEEVEYKLVGTGTESGTAKCAFRIVPKLISEDMQLEIAIGNKTHSLTKDGNGFTGTVEIKMFDEDGAIPSVAVKTASGTQVQKLEDVDLYWACRNWLPELFQSMSGTSSTEKGFPQVDLAYGFWYETEVSETPVTFVKITEIKTVDGKEVSNRDVTDQLRDGGEPDFYEYYTGFIMEKQQSVVLTIRAEDSLGYIHVLETYIDLYANSDGSPEISESFESIYTPDGELLYNG
jgi:hypothetical protein